MNNPFSRGIQMLRIGWGARKAGQAHSDAERLLAQRALSAMLAGARGVTMKVGQLFADTDSDNPFRQLLDNIEPLPLADILPFIESQLGHPWQQSFRHIEEAHAAASLGQVHHAILLDGREVALKVRYPDIADAVNAELKLAGLMPGVGPVKKWGIDLDAYKTVLKTNMDQELDYLSEARRQSDYAQQVQVTGLHTPEIIEEYCRSGLLVQSWEQGSKLDEIIHWPIPARQELGKILIRTLFSSLFKAGLVHGDPHMGNYFFRQHPAPGVVLLDYGCTIEVSKTARLALLKFILALREDRDISPLQAFAAMGFDAQKLAYIKNSLPLISRILFRPFLGEQALRMQDWKVKQPMIQLLGEQRWWFRSAGPANLLLLMRAFQGLEQQLEILQIYQPWWPLLRESVGDELLQQARDFVLPPLPEGLEQGPGLKAIAETLYVEVLKNGAPHVKVSLPAEAAMELASLMPEDVLKQLESSSDIDLEAIQQRIYDSGIAAQMVFEYQHGEKTYRVWLK